MDDKEIEHLWDMVELNGVVCSSVKDGHVLAFKKDFLQKLIDKHPDKERVIIFVQKPGPAS
jgi:hypothetical protein